MFWLGWKFMNHLSYLMVMTKAEMDLTATLCQMQSTDIFKDFFYSFTCKGQLYI